MAANYFITGQKQDININPIGSGFMPVWEVSYKVTDGPARGTTGMITVPEEDHNAEYVNREITNKIETLGNIAALGQK